MREVIDMHSHILPYVDDGATEFDESIVLLQELARQGATRACLTPHLRHHMFDTPDNEIRMRFAELKKRAADKNIPIELYLSREYHCDKRFFMLLEKHQLMPMGKGKTVLCEFSHSSSEDFIYKTVKAVQRHGYIPLVAHAERYAAVHDDTDFIHKLRMTGALIQVNADSVAGSEGFSQKMFCKKLVKKKLIDVIGSDAHDPLNRPPRLKECAERIAKIAGPAYAKKVMYWVPLQILEDSI